ncbi:MAG TPA: hypothetical protein VFE50_20325 [Cyclobacteriaceae bacterium]|nr:hypothetical protein [Cyclobacteriaceae bacterium]
MENSISKHNDVLAKKALMAEIALQLKKQFIGLSELIDGVMSLVTAWYIFPQAQLRPLAINLWGLTGSGKTALVKQIVELLDHKKFYAHFDMGEFESESAKWIKRSFIDDLSHFNGEQAIICLDEFQFARSIRNGEEVTNDKLRTVWELLDSGKIFYTSDPDQYYVRRVEKCITALQTLRNCGGEISNGEVVAGQELFLKLFESCFLDRDDRNDEPMSVNYLKSADFIDGLLVLDDSTTPRALVIKQVCSFDLDGLIGYVSDLVKRAVTPRELDLRKSVIFILGNLDEAYRMSSNLNPDLNPDDFHEATKKITIPNIKNALATRFRSEQIARLGNNHFLYRAFSTAQFRELIRRDLERLSKFAAEQFQLTLVFENSVHDVVFAEGVIPSQGTRPVFTTINNLIQSRMGTVAMHAHAATTPVSVVRWSHRENEFLFELRSEGGVVVSVVSEEVHLQLESQRRPVDPHLQAHTAVHEAGHGILAALLLRIVPSVIISRSASHDAEGFCRVRYPEGPLTRETLRKSIVITLGGLAAEKIVFGDDNSCSGVSSDIEHASTLANDAIRRYAMGIDPIRLAVVRAYANEDFFVDSSKYEEESVKLIRECMMVAGMILERNKLLLLEMSEYLTHNSKMEMNAIEEFVRKYSVEEWVNDTGFIQPEQYFEFDKIVKNQLVELETAERFVDEIVSESLA